MMKTSMRYCRPCNKTTKHSITEEDIKLTLKKEVRTCTQCKITLSRVVSTKDKITLICYKCKEKTWHFKEKWHYQCTICGDFRKIGF
jgi:hypothetical protein